MDMIMASTRMRPECARTTGRAARSLKLVKNIYKNKTRNEAKGGAKRKEKNVPIPIMTKNPVKKRPTSTIAAPALSTKSSGFAHRPQIQFGTGARTYVATTRSGRYELCSAHERMTRRKPSARTNERAMIVLRPAVGIVAVGGGCFAWRRRNEWLVLEEDSWPFSLSFGVCMCCWLA